MVVVVVTVVGGVVVVVVVDEGAVAPAPPAAEEPVPTTVKVAVGADPPDSDVGACAATASAVGVPPVDEATTPLAAVPVPAPPALADPLVGVVLAGGVPAFGEGAEPADLAAIWGNAVGPAPRFSPATIDTAAAATEAAATNRLWTKYGLAAVCASGGTASAGTSWSVCPKARRREHLFESRVIACSTRVGCRTPHDPP